MKKYILKTIGIEHSLPVRVEGEADNRYVKFVKVSPSDASGCFDTDDKKLQEAIETSPFFERGEIELLFSSDEDEANEPSTNVQLPVDVTEYPDVTTFKEAREILSGEPYNIPVTSREISNSEKVFAKAAELGVSFPNLK